MKKGGGIILPRVLTIAGSDSGGGAGIQADLKTFAKFGVYGTSAITAVTAQNTKGVQDVLVMSGKMVQKQIESIMNDIGADVWKTGMLGSSKIVSVVAGLARRYKIERLVVDPVIIAKSGKELLEKEAVDILIRELIPQSLVITPNCYEAEALTGIRIVSVKDMKKAAKILSGMGARNIVVKGGHLPDTFDAIDILYNKKTFIELIAPRIRTKNTHGTGCTFAAAIAAELAKGESIESAVRIAKDYISTALKKAANLRIGKGNGPVDVYEKIRTSFQSR